MPDTIGEITKRELIVINSVVTTKIYDGNTAATITGATLSGVLGSDVVVLANHEAGTFSDKNVGTGKAVTTAITITGDDTGNYTLIQPSPTGEITKKAITITAVANSKVYDDNVTAIAEPTITAGELVTDDVGLYIETYDNQNVGDTKILIPEVISIVDGASVDMAGNYDVTPETVNLGTITVKTATVTAQTDTKIYDGDTSSDSVPVGGDLQGDDTWVSEGTQTYDTKDVGANKTLTPAEALINDGNNGNNYVISYVNAVGVINAKEVIVTANASQTKIYGADDPIPFTYTHDALVGNDEFEGALSRVAGEDVGTYVFTIGTLDAGTNYNLSVAAAPTFSITRLSITGNFTAGNKTYDGNTGAVILTQTLNGVIGGDDVTLTVSTASFVDANVADDITVTASGMTLTGTTAGNYNLASVADTTANIIALPITVTADVQTKIYGADDVLPFAYTPNPDLIGDDEFEGALSRVAGEDIGTYKIQQGDLTAGGNYVITYTSADLTIAKKDITVTADSKTKNYGTDDPAVFTYAFVPVLETGDSFSGNLSRVTGEDIGTYEIQQGSLTAGSNYNIIYNSADLTIIDAIAPVTTDNVPAGWQNLDITVILTCDDTAGGNSGCLKVYYTTNNADPTTLSNFVDVANNWQFTISTDGEYTIKYRGEDVANNLEVVKTASNILQLDKTAPTINNLYLSPQHTSVTSDTTPEISADFIENGSGVNINSVGLTFSGNEYADDYATKSTASVTYIPQIPLDPDTYEVTVTVADNAGNSTTKTWSFIINPEFIIDTTPEPVFTYNIPLSAGWNLVSLPLIPNSIVIEDVLANISGDVDVVWYYDTGGWLSYKPEVSGGTLETIEDGKGYWINMDVANTLIVNGVEMPGPGPAETPPTYPVVTGWNLIGFKSVDSVKSSTYLSGVSYITVYGYDESYFPVTQSASGGIDNDMNPGSGYWLYASAAGNIVP